MIHFFDTNVAKECGVNAAVIFTNISHWVSFNEANEKNFIDGRYWTYNSRKAFQTLFPYLSEKQVRTAIDKLRDAGLIDTAQHSDDPLNRTLWFALTDRGYAFSNGHDLPNNGISGLAQKGQCMLAIEGQSSHIINNTYISLEDSFEDNKLSSHSSSFVPHPSKEKCETPTEPQKIFINFPLLGGKSVDITEEWCDEQQRLFGNAVNIRDEIKLAIAWCHANHYKQKWKAFLNSWFNTCLKKGGSAVPYEPKESEKEEKKEVKSRRLNILPGETEEEAEARLEEVRKATRAIRERARLQEEERQRELVMESAK